MVVLPTNLCRLTAAADKQPVCELFALTREDGAELEGATLRTTAKKALTDAAVLRWLILITLDAWSGRWPRIHSGAGIHPASATETSLLRTRTLKGLCSPSGLVGAGSPCAAVGPELSQSKEFKSLLRSNFATKSSARKWV